MISTQYCCTISPKRQSLQPNLFSFELLTASPKETRFPLGQLRIKEIPEILWKPYIRQQCRLAEHRGYLWRMPAASSTANRRYKEAQLRMGCGIFREPHDRFPYCFQPDDTADCGDSVRLSLCPFPLSKYRPEMLQRECRCAVKVSAGITASEHEDLVVLKGWDEVRGNALLPVRGQSSFRSFKMPEYIHLLSIYTLPVCEFNEFIS